MDDQLREEKETTEGTQLELKDNLLHRRQEAITLARQLEKEKGEYQLESIVCQVYLIITHENITRTQTLHTQSYRLQASQDSFKANLLSQQNDVPPVEPELSRAEQLDQLLAVSLCPLSCSLTTVYLITHIMTHSTNHLHL